MKHINGEEGGTSYEYAGFRRRLLAYMVDWAILASIGVLIQIMIGQNPLATFKATTLAELNALNASNNQTVLFFVGLLVGLAYYLVMWVNFNGATIGKKMVGIKIIKTDGKSLGYSNALIRYVSQFISAFCVYLGYLWIIWDKQKQSWHDKLAGTYVIKTGAKSNTVAAVLFVILAHTIFTIYFGGLMFHGIKIGLTDPEAKKAVVEKNKKIESPMVKEMLPGAKVHYDNADELFKQMKAVSDKPVAVKPLADKTIKELLLAAEIEPNNPLIWNSLGNAYTWVNNVGTLDNSLNAYKKAEELEPTNFVYSGAVGEILLRMRKYDEAVLQLNRTLRQEPNYSYAHLSIAKAYKGLGVYQEMAKHLRSAIALFEIENKNGAMDSYILEAQKLLNNPN